LRPPRRRPIGVRAPATMTDWVMMRGSFEDCLWNGRDLHFTQR
jgi:hypothetical protein